MCGRHERGHLTPRMSPDEQESVSRAALLSLFPQNKLSLEPDYEKINRMEYLHIQGQGSKVKVEVLQTFSSRPAVDS